MTTIITDSGPHYSGAARAIGDELWLTAYELKGVAGWEVREEGFCKGEYCVAAPEERMMASGRVNVSALWGKLGWPILHDARTNTWILGEGAELRSRILDSLDAPDFILPDLSGALHRLSDYRGSKIVLVTWASWCGCREDLSTWEQLYQELKDQNLVIIAVALDSRGIEAAREWIDKAQPSYPCLIDVDHRVAELYGMVNVPQAVWIGEDGRIRRPTESAGVTDAFRAMNPSTHELPEKAKEELERARSLYLDAIRDWAQNGDDSAFVPDEATARGRVMKVHDDIAMAQACFRLGRFLVAQNHRKEGMRYLREAAELHPDSWSIWRQMADFEEVGKSMGPEFWARVKALGKKKYYEPADIPGMPG
jgi:peroxiredoxin